MIIRSSATKRLALTPNTYRRLADIALLMLTLIVLTGAAVRLTGSGLGCPDWPRCYGKVAPPLETHAVIEFGNRILSGIVGISAISAALLAFMRRPFRRDLALLGLALPLGVVGQAVLGGFTVRYHLAPGFVMGHYALSLVILAAAVALAWRARRDDQLALAKARRSTVWLTRGLLFLGALTILLGTAATAAGPHAGGRGTGDVIHRLTWFGSDTLDWAIHQHATLATLLGIAALLSWALARRRKQAQLSRSLAVVVGLLALQGVVGLVQYALKLPAEIVWLHVSLATLTWIALLWATAVSSKIVPAEASLSEIPVPTQPTACRSKAESAVVHS